MLAIIALINPVSNVALHCASISAELSMGVMLTGGPGAALAIETRKEANNKITMNLVSIPFR